MFHASGDTFTLCVSALQCLNLLAFTNEMKAPTAYSKFARTTSRSVPSKVGMLIIYTPAMCAAGFCVAAPATTNNNGRELLVATMLFLHFAKRVVETVAVHHYSGSLDGGVGGFIGLFYALLTLLISSQQAAVPRAVYHETAETLLPVGVALFIAGEVGNLYHHWLLAQMRTPAKQAQPVQEWPRCCSSTPSPRLASAPPAWKPAGPPALASSPNQTSAIAPPCPPTGRRSCCEA